MLGQWSMRGKLGGCHRGSSVAAFVVVLGSHQLRLLFSPKNLQKTDLHGARSREASAHGGADSTSVLQLTSGARSTKGLAEVQIGDFLCLKRWTITSMPGCPTRGPSGSATTRSAWRSCGGRSSGAPATTSWWTTCAGRRCGSCGACSAAAPWPATARSASPRGASPEWGRHRLRPAGGSGHTLGLSPVGICAACGQERASACR